MLTEKERQLSSSSFLGTEGERGCVAEGGESEDSQGQYQVTGCKSALWWPGTDVWAECCAGELPTSLQSNSRKVPYIRGMLFFQRCISEIPIL